MYNLINVWEYCKVVFFVWKDEYVLAYEDKNNMKNKAGMRDLLEADEYSKCIKWSELQRI